MIVRRLVLVSTVRCVVSLVPCLLTGGPLYGGIAQLLQQLNYTRRRFGTDMATDFYVTVVHFCSTAVSRTAHLVLQSEHT